VRDNKILYVSYNELIEIVEHKIDNSKTCIYFNLRARFFLQIVLFYVITLYKGGIFMDSNSKYPLHGELCNCKQDRDCKCQHPFGNKVIFESRYGNLGPIDVTFAEAATLQALNQPIGSITVDTACEEVKTVVIDFTGILNVTTTVAAISTLTFTLYRICSDMRTRQPVSTVNFSIADTTGGLTTSHTLAFKFPFKNEECKDCCTYVLELINISNFDFGTITYSINGTLSALVIVSSR